MRRIAAAALGLLLLSVVLPGPVAGARPGGDSPRAGFPVDASPPDGASVGMRTVIVTMRSQADLAAVPGVGRRLGRRNVVMALRAHAAQGQRAILRYLDGEAARGRVAAIVPFWVFDGLSVTATEDVIAAIGRRADVSAVADDDAQIVPLGRPKPSPSPSPTPAPTPTPTPTPPPTPAPTPTPTPSPSAAPTPTPLPDPVGSPEPGIAAAGAPALWGLGFTGRGVVVASLDSGVDASHPDLGPRWRGGAGSWFDPYDQHPADPVDMTGHGTATMGVMVGGDAGGTTIGMAPGATWIAARIFDDLGSATATAVHRAFQWVLDPDDDPATDDAPDVVNNSWSFGGIGCNLEFEADLQALRAAGILPVFAGGNAGPGTGTSVSPANNPASLAVGSVDATDAIDPLSSRGPSSCGEPPTTYPEVVAPGVDIRTADRFGLFQVATGTSMAAPHAAGALALLLDAHPGLAADEQAAALVAGAADLGPAGPDNAYGAGRIDVPAAHAWLVANPPPAPPRVTSISPSSGPAAGGTAVTIDGSGFSTATDGTAVAFGTAPATDVSCASESTCTATSPGGVIGTVDIRVTVDGRTSDVTAADRFSYVATPVTDPVSVPALGKGYGYWFTVTSAADGTVAASWTTPATIQGTLAVYAGNPFAGGPNPVRRSPPSGALATMSARRSAFSVATAVRPPGVFTVYVYAGAAVGASTGTITSWR